MKTPTRDAQLNVYNVAAMLAAPPDRFDTLRVDSNNDCNVQCVYCHNHRSPDMVSRGDLLRFLNDRVIELRTFQMGCVMEPTLDPRLCDLLLDVSASRSKPQRSFVLQTNGILLHQHEPAKMRDAGLTHLAVSIDAADPQIHKALRGGTSLSKVVRNLERLMPACPLLQVGFITTVSRHNLEHIPELVQFGLNLGVTHFVLREVFHNAGSDVVDHAQMSALTLADGEFARMSEALRAAFEGTATFDFADTATLEQVELKMLDDSLRPRAR
jgi:MoaA/NifB/PqqE/SkfB family radical SAM enzyme